MKTLPLATAILALGAAYHLRAPSAPEGQRPLRDDLDALKAEFNQASNKTRAIVLVSPSCPYCLKGATVIESILAKHPSAEVAVFVVWQPILPTDWGPPRSWALARLSDPRAAQFHDPNHGVAAALSKLGEAQKMFPDCCYDNGSWWDMLAVFPPGGEWTESLPNAAFMQGTAEEAAPQFEAALK